MSSKQGVLLLFLHASKISNYALIKYISFSYLFIRRLQSTVDKKKSSSLLSIIIYWKYFHLMNGKKRWWKITWNPTNYEPLLLKLHIELTNYVSKRMFGPLSSITNFLCLLNLSVWTTKNWIFFLLFFKTQLSYSHCQWFIKLGVWGPCSGVVDVQGKHMREKTNKVLQLCWPFFTQF